MNSLLIRNGNLVLESESKPEIEEKHLLHFGLCPIKILKTHLFPLEANKKSLLAVDKVFNFIWNK